MPSYTCYANNKDDAFLRSTLNPGESMSQRVNRALKEYVDLKSVSMAEEENVRIALKNGYSIRGEK